MNLTLKKAVRAKIPLRIALIGPSGSGKTYSALRLAKGMTSVTGGDIFLLDTEKGRGRVYANEFDYFYEEFAEPFSPERYVEYIKAVGGTKLVKVLIIDSAFHEWEYLLGVLATLKDKNDFTKWDKITPRHWDFVKAILGTEMHVIVNLRGKDQYVMEERNGKSVPKKKGLGPQFRPGFEYECNVSFLLDREGNTATADKDDTHRYREGERTLTEEDGAFLAKWADSGESFIAHPAPVSMEAPAPAASRPMPPTDIEIKAWARSIADAPDLEAIKAYWGTIQDRLKLCDDATIQRFKHLAETRKLQIEAVPDTSTGIFDRQGKLREEVTTGSVTVEPAAPDPNAPTYEQTVTERNYRSFIAGAKIKKALEGLTDAIEAELDAKKLTEAQASTLNALIDEKAESFRAGRNGSAPAGAAKKAAPQPAAA